MAQYRQFLKNKNFALLWASQTISQFGDRLNQMALIGVVYEKMSASPLALAKIFTVAIIPVFLISPVAGVYVDRWDFRRTMLFSDIIRGFLILTIPLLLLHKSPVWGIYAIIFLAFCIGRFFIPAKLSLVPELVPPEQIFMANSLISTTGMVAAVIGFGIGGVLVERWGARGAFILDALTFFASAGLIGGITLRKPKKRFSPTDFLDLGKSLVTSIQKSFYYELKEGIHYIVTAPKTRFVFQSLSILFACLGALYVVLITFIQTTLGSKTQDLGFLAVCLGLGLFLGSLVYGKIGVKFCAVRTITISLLVSGLYLIIFVVALRYFPETIFAMISTSLLGFIIAPIVIGGSSLIHRDSNKELWGRIFSSLEVVIHFFFLICMLLASYLAEKFSPFAIIISVGSIIVVVSLSILLKNKKMESPFTL